MRSLPTHAVRSVFPVAAICLSAVACRVVVGGPPPHLAPEDLTAAVRFQEDREAAQLVAQAREAIRSGDNTGAVALLQEVLDSHRSGLLQTPEGFRSGLQEAWRLLRDSPPGLIDQYRRHSGGVARAELDAAIESGDERDLLGVAVRFRFTVAAESALETVAQRRFDAARFPEAATLYGELIRGGPDPARQARENPAAVDAWIISLHEAGADQEALAVAAEFASASDAHGRIQRLLTQLREQVRSSENPGSTPRESAGGGQISPWMPSGRAEWEFAFNDAADGDADSELQILREFSAAGVSPYLQARPLETSDGLVVRSARGVVRLDSRSGVVAWRWPEESADRSQLPPAAGRVASRERLRLLERAIGDSVHAGLTADRERVYFLEEQPDRATFPDDATLSNVLIALDADAGDELWVRGGEDDEDAAFRDIFFRGTPTVYGDEILIVGDRAASTELFALNASTGDLTWAVKLCSIAPGPVRDDRRLAQQCRVLLSSGMAVCATGGGALVAVGLISHEVRWACRYPREPVFEDESGRESQAQRERQLVWGDSWCALQLAASGERIVLASGESDALHVLDTASGSVLWSRPRQDATFVGCVTDAHVILVDPHHVSAVRLDDGTTDWSVAVDHPSGQGCIADGHYLLPLLNGGVAAVRLADGHLTRTYALRDTKPGIVLNADIETAKNWRPVTLVRTDGQVIEQSADGIRRLVNLAEALSVAEAALEDAANIETAVAHADHLREAGDFRGAAEILLTQLDDDEHGSKRDRLRQSTLDSLLTESWWTQDASPLDDIRPQLIESDADRLRIQLCRFRAGLRSPSPAAINDALGLLDLQAERYFLSREDGTGWVRLDRQVQAWLQDYPGQADEPTRSLLNDALSAALQQRVAGSGGTQAHRVLSFFDHFSVAQSLRVELPPRWSTITEFIRHELELEQLAVHGDGAIAAGALRALIQLYEAHSNHRRAARTWLRLQSLASAAPQSIVIDEIPDDSPLHRYVEDPSLPAWPSRDPDVNSAPGANHDALYFTLPEIVATNPELVDGLTVNISRNGDRLRFSGGVWSQQWHLDLPSARNGELLGNEIFADLRRAWTFGNLLLIQVGGNVFGVAPLNRNGEPSAELLWPDQGELVSSGVRVAQIFVNPQSDSLRRHGFVERRLLLDRRLQPVGQVGPVHRGYFCVRRGGELTAFDTATGARLWTRSGISPAVQLHGDDAHLALIRPDSARVLLLRVLDGALLSSFEWSQHGGELLSCYGCRALVLRSSDERTPVTSVTTPLHLTLSDLTNGEPVWSRVVSEESVVFPVDATSCGLLEEDGTVRMIDLNSGEDFAAHEVPQPGLLTGVRTMLDQDTLYLMLTEPMDDPAIQATLRPDGRSPNTGFRNFEINGWMHAFERSSGRLLWSRDVDNAVVALDQSRDVPILIFQELRIADTTSSVLECHIRVLDKRTGDTLLDESSATPISRYRVHRNRQDGWVEIHCPDRIYRLNYRAPPASDQSP